MSASDQLRGAVSNTPAERANTFPVLLEKSFKEIARALPRHLNADRMSRIALTAYRQNPLLAECDPRSVIGAVIQSAQLGLEIGLLGEAHLVPFGKSKKVDGQWVKTYECTLIPGWQGLVKLVIQSGVVRDIYAHEVRQNDKFDCVFGLQRTLMHEPLKEHGFVAPEEKRGPVAGFYAVAILKDGTPTFVPMSVEQVNRIRDRSSGYRSAVEAAKKYGKENASPWHTDYVAMGLKTVIRALCKFLPKSPELQNLERALDLDEAANRGLSQGLEATQNVIDGTWSVPPQEEAEPEPPAEQQGQQTEPEKPQTQRADLPPYAVLRERIEKATTNDGRMLALEDAGHLPADQQQELQQLALSLGQQAAQGRKPRSASMG